MISGVANRFSQFSLKEELADPASHPELIARYRARGPEAYRRAIGRVIGFATRVYGDRLVSPQSFGRCLQIAYLYPLVALLVGWVIFDTATLGGFPLLESRPVFWDGELWRFLALLLSWAVALALILG